jgi:hypothetical protein
VDDQRIWMLLKREMFETCQSANALGEYPAGHLLCVLTKLYLIARVEGTAKRLSIVWSGGEPSVERAQFRLEIWRTENSQPSAYALTADANLLFTINGDAKQFSAHEICGKILDMLCAQSAEEANRDST